jgi:hypothetical protein
MNGWLYAACLDYFFFSIDSSEARKQYDEYCLSIMQAITYAHDRTHFQAGTTCTLEWNSVVIKDRERDVKVLKNFKIYFKRDWNKSSFDINSVVFQFDDFRKTITTIFFTWTKPGGVMYMCVRDIEFTYDFSIECWNCSESVIYIFSFYYRLWKQTAGKKNNLDRQHIASQ